MLTRADIMSRPAFGFGRAYYFGFGDFRYAGCGLSFHDCDLSGDRFNRKAAVNPYPEFEIRGLPCFRTPAPAQRRRLRRPTT